jgi:hypothetical protein
MSFTRFLLGDIPHLQVRCRRVDGLADLRLFAGSQQALDDARGRWRLLHRCAQPHPVGLGLEPRIVDDRHT